MQVGDLVKLKHRRSGQPRAGLIIEIMGGEYMILWDLSEWGITRWKDRELEVINEAG